MNGTPEWMDTIKGRPNKYIEYINGISSSDLSRKDLADLRRAAYMVDRSLVDDMLNSVTAKYNEHTPATQAVCILINDTVADIKSAQYRDTTRKNLIKVDYEALKTNAGKEILS